MAVEIKTSGVKPLRNTFSHLAARFGDKAATRYQEIAFDTQPSTNFHYKPLWAPEQELYDTSTTAIKMSDWYALKDPRQYYYGSWTTTRAKQQDAIDQQLAFTEKRDLFSLWPEDARNFFIYALLPLRHYEWGGNTNNNFIAAYGYGTTITQAATMGMCDRLGMAQFISRIGLCIDGKTGASLEQARNIWLSDPAWMAWRIVLSPASSSRSVWIVAPVRPGSRAGRLERSMPGKPLNGTWLFPSTRKQTNGGAAMKTAVSPNARMKFCQTTPK